MVDSDNSTSLSIVTRRQLLACTASLAVPANQSEQLAVHYPEAAGGGDIALRRWRDWNAAHARTETLCVQQQELESRLLAAVSSRAAHPGEAEAGAIPAKSPGGRVASDADREPADPEVSYRLAKQAEEEAGREEQELAEILFATPASSLAGISAKLTALLRLGETREEDEEFPWPQIRSVIGDITRLGRNGKMIVR